MTVENQMTFVGSSQMAPGSYAGDRSSAIHVGASRAIHIPAPRRRHPSLGSTGSAGSNYDSGGSMAGSPPLHELLTLQLSQNSTSPQNGSPKSQTNSQDHQDSGAVYSSGHKSNINPSRYKTELCRPYEENGYCKYGEKCQFAHGRAELRSLSRHPKYKTELCRTYHKSGFCPYGPRCHFIHDEDIDKLNRINQQKQQQILQQVAQHVATQQRHQVLCQAVKMALPSGQLIVPPPVAPTCSLPLSVLPLASLGWTTESSPPASITHSPPAISPVSMSCAVGPNDDVLPGLPTPPPGFSTPPLFQPAPPISNSSPPPPQQKMSSSSSGIGSHSVLNTFTLVLDAALPGAKSSGTVTPPPSGILALLQNDQSTSTSLFSHPGM